MPQINLMTAPAQTMQRDKHRLPIFLPYTLKLCILIKRSPRQQLRIGAFVSRNDKIHGESPREGGVLGVEDAPFVVDGDVVAANGGPKGLEVAVEEEGVEVAGRGDAFAELEQV